MMFVVVLLLLQMCGTAFGAHGCHHNHNGLTDVDVIGLVLDDMDHDKDSYITADELSGEFVLKFDHNGDNEVSEKEFVQHWHTTYHDAKDFSARVYFFLMTGLGPTLTISKAPQIIQNHDTNGDGKLSYDEFNTALLKVYHDCP